MESGYTPLHRALLHGRVTCAQILLDYEAGLASGPADQEGLTPLELLRADARSGDRDAFSLKVRGFWCARGWQFAVSASRVWSGDSLGSKI